MIGTKAAFALRLVDDYSGRVITGKHFLFRKEGQTLKPVRKEEGLYVFLEPMNETERIEISGADYFPCAAVVEKEKLKRTGLVMNVRLYGRPGGNFPYRRGLEEGTLPEEWSPFPVQVCVRRRRKTGLSVKEIRKEKGEQHLVVHGFTREQLTGKTFAVSAKKRTEVFVIAQKLGMNEYRIEGEITGKYPDQTPIERAYRSVTDAGGSYWIPVEPEEMGDLTEIAVL